jgi:hypothetical protein
VNKKIVITGFIIIGGGVLNVWIGAKSNQASVTGVIVGGYVLILILSLLDAFGGQLSTLAGALALLAAVYVVVNTYLPILMQAGKTVSGTTASATAPGPVVPSYPPNQH